MRNEAAVTDRSHHPVPIVRPTTRAAAVFGPAKRVQDAELERRDRLADKLLTDIVATRIGMTQ